MCVCVCERERERVISLRVVCTCGTYPLFAVCVVHVYTDTKPCPLWSKMKLVHTNIQARTLITLPRQAALASASLKMPLYFPQLDSDKDTLLSRVSELERTVQRYEAERLQLQARLANLHSFCALNELGIGDKVPTSTCMVYF